MNIIITLCVLSLTTLIGFLVIERLRLIRGDNVALKIAMGFGVGFGIGALQMFLYYILNIEWSREGLVIPYVIILPLLLKKIKLRRIRFSFANIPKVNYFLITLIALLAAFTMFESVLRPLSSWDGWSSWQMRAKVYFHEKQISVESFHYLQTEYPLAVSLYSTFLYVVLDEVDDTAVQLISWFFYIMVGLTAYAFIKKEAGTRPALWASFLLLSTQNLIRHGGRFEAGMADIVLGYYILAALIALYYYISSKELKQAILFVLFLIIATQIKNEGTAFSLIAVLIYAYYAIRAGRSHLFVLIFYAFALIGWQVFKFLLNLPKSILMYPANFDGFTFIRIVWEELVQYLSIQNWNMGWFYFFVTLFLINRKYVVFYIAICVQILLYVFIFLTSSMVPWEHAKGISDRLFLHLYPSAVTVSMLTTFMLLKKRTIFGKLIYG